MNIFEKAARKKLRFSTARGDLSTEHLFELPLTSRDSFNLDQVARNLHGKIKTMGEGSFVETEPTPGLADAELALDIVKYVIKAKLDAQKAATDRADKAQKRQKLLEALAAKEGDELAGKTKDQILADLAALDE